MISRHVPKTVPAAVFLSAAWAMAGCRGGPSEDSPILLIRNMHRQPKLLAQAEFDLFADGRSMRPPVEGTVSRSQNVDTAETTGRTEEGDAYVLSIPEPVRSRAGGAEALVKRGQDRYGIYCTPCHARTGLPEGMVVKRGFQPPPSLHDPRVRAMPDGQIYATIKNGVRNMPAYGTVIPVDDRWAIVAYVRALQLTNL